VIEEAPGHPAIVRIVAPNPGPMTLEGTNTYLVGPVEDAGGGCFVIDPGPADEGHAARIRAAAAERGGMAGILLTHSHADHSLGAALLDAPLLIGRVSDSGEGAPVDPDVGWAPDAGTVGPFELLPTPGHAADHVAFVLGSVCFCGDLVLGQGSSFVPPDGGSLAAYLESLGALRALGAELLCPGHGPFITDPEAKLDEYIEHRLERERKLLAALAEGERSRSRLLEMAWSDVPAELRPAAAIVMEAHLDKLAAEGGLSDNLVD
jgi:glyoxylase-like metal-dependent hydrolase (beta-lactamase superfamily II)